MLFFKQKTAYEMRISDGVQTCALPICLNSPTRTLEFRIDESFATHEAHARHRAACDRLVAVRMWHDNRFTVSGSTPSDQRASRGRVSRAAARTLDAGRHGMHIAHQLRQRQPCCHLQGPPGAL